MRAIARAERRVIRAAERWEKWRLEKNSDQQLADNSLALERAVEALKRARRGK
jgi:hypothetical protein